MRPGNVISLCLLLALTGATSAARPEVRRRPGGLRDLGRGRKVRLVYFVPADRKPTRAWRGKIQTVMTFVNDLFRSSLRGGGFADGGLDFEFARDGHLTVHLVRGRHAAAHYNGAPKYAFLRQWQTILPEVTKALGPADKRLFAIFAETYDPGANRYEWPGGVALGAQFSSDGGVGLFSAWILRDAFCADSTAGQLKLLADATPIRGRTALGCGKPNSPRFEFIEDGFGALAHELGHALGLWHDHRRDRLYIMGNGFRSLRWNYLRVRGAAGKVCFSPDNTRMLAFTRLLNAKADLEDNRPPTIKLDCPKQIAAGTTKITVEAEVRDDKALGASVLFCDHGDSVVWGKGHAGRADRAEITFEIRPAKPGEIRLHLGTIDRGGNLARARGKIAVK